MSPSRRRNNPAASGPEDVRASALRILAGREHSAAQLQQKLQARGFEPHLCVEVVDRLMELDLLSETRFAEVLVRSRISQGYGPLRIYAELKEARVSDADVRRAMAENPCDFAEQAEQARARKFGALPEAAAQWQKQYRFLAGRGFEPEQIRSALKRADQD